MAANEKRRPGAIQDRRGVDSRTRENDAKIDRRRVDFKGRVDFAAVNRAALEDLPAILARWLPDGSRRGDEWTARNPKRDDRRPGSFRVNVRTGAWADFALPDVKGGDPVSLAAYLHDLSQVEAARSLAGMLGVTA